jgi:segregation and condensation protein A
MHKSSMIGVFLAVLELARHHNVRTEQADLNAEILVVPGEGFAPELRISDIDNYDSGQLKELGIDAGR